MTKELLFRYRARNFPQTLNETEQLKWRQHRQEVLTTERVENYLQQLDNLYHLHAEEQKKVTLLKALFDYAKQLVG